MNDLKDTKINEKNSLQLIDDGYFVFCSNYTGEICKISDRIIYEITYCCYVICSNKSCHNIIDNLNNCLHYVKASETLDTVDEFERDYDSKKSGDENDLVFYF